MDLDLLNRTVGSAFGETTAVQWLDAARDLNGIFDSRHFEVDAGGEVPASELVTTTLSEESQTEDVDRRTMIRTVVVRIDLVVATTGDVDDDVDDLCVAVESAPEGDDEPRP